MASCRRPPWQGICGDPPVVKRQMYTPWWPCRRIGRLVPPFPLTSRLQALTANVEHFAQRNACDVMLGRVTSGALKWACSFLLMFASSFVVDGANPLPASRTPGGRGSWAGLVGVPGGIPNRQTIYATFNSGASASSINSAIAACPSNQVVYLNAGTYSGNIAINKSGVTLRGAGPTKTIINGNIEIGDWHVWDAMTTSPSSGNHVNWTAGLSQGSTNITVASASGYSVGQLIVLDQLNDANTSAWNNESSYSPNKGISVAYPNDGRDRIQYQLNRIAAINGSNITLENPVYMPNLDANLDPETWRFPSQPVVMSGAEGLRCGFFRFHYTYACWATNVTSVACQSDVGTFMCLWSARNSIVGCTITSSSTCSDGYGLELRGCAGLLIENNIIDKIGPALMPNCTQGSVIAYNVITNVTSASSWMSAGFLNHGSFPCMNLIEGNVVPRIDWDNTDGPSGYNVAHRNWCQGIDQARTAYGNIEAISIQGTNRNHSVIGNVLGTAGVTYAAYQDGPNCSGGKRIYAIGFWRAECSTPYDPVTASTLIRAYNWNQYNSAIVADGYGASDIPASYYLTSKPSWFGNLAWPPIDPSNPTYSRSWTNVPAGYRLVYGVDPPAGPVNQPPVAVASASPKSGLAPLAVSFSSAGSYDPEGTALTYSWTFGNGATSTAANPAYTYQTPGVYSARLTVSDGTNTTSSTNLTISVANQSPVVAASAAPTNGAAPLTVTFSSAGSHDPEGTTLTYNWVFGDGATSTAANPSRTYQAASNYIARLTVSDGTNSTTSANLNITVSAPASNRPPVAVASATPTNGVAPLVVTFSSAGSYDPDGTTLAYSWVFGDGSTSTTPNPSHTYQGASNYIARLTVSDGTNSRASGNLNITVSAPASNRPPVAVASATPTNGVAPLTVTFSSAGSYDPDGTTLTYSWVFGDGATSTAANPGHTYQAASNYIARLTVSDGTNSTTSANLNITVSAPASNRPPVAVASASPTNGVAPLTVTFSSAGSYDPDGTTLTYNWVFGDGSTSTAANPSHTYQGASNYTARLTVSDSTNAASSGAVTITVAESGSGLVAAYGFEEGSGSSVSDASGNGNTGTIVGAAWTDGKFGKALSFSGTSCLVTINDSASLDLTSEMTLEAWVYPMALGGWRDIIFKGTDIYFLMGSTPQAQRPCAGGSFTSTNAYGLAALPTNTWTHLVGTYDGATLRLYTNGVLVSSRAQTGAIATSAGALSIGGDSTYGQYWNGLIDEVRIYNRALSVSEIQTGMNTPVTVVNRPAPPTDLMVFEP